jgi:hypothetical protein
MPSFTFLVTVFFASLYEQRLLNVIALAIIKTFMFLPYLQIISNNTGECFFTFILT